MNNDYLFEALPLTAEAMGKLMRRIPPEKLDTPTHPGRFSPREVIAHMADWEPRLLERMKMAKASSGAAVEAYDEGLLAEENDYAGSDWVRELDSFAASRQATIDWLKTLAKEDFDLWFDHPERGKTTIEDQSAMNVGHDQYHLDQLSEVALSK